MNQLGERKKMHEPSFELIDSPMHDALTAVPEPQIAVDQTRVMKMAGELRQAFAAMPRSEFQALVLAVGIDFRDALVRRASRLGKFAYTAGKAVVGEVANAANATMEGRFGHHLGGRAAGGIDAVQDITLSAKALGSAMVDAVRKDPVDSLVRMSLFTLASLVASGGIDGDGGVSDLDISMFGIDAHRSLLTHSFISGALLETACLLLVRSIDATHRHLPAERDLWWDAAHSRVHPAVESISQGLSVGIAYHLLVDGLVQPAPYHDLPFSMPLEAHQTVMTANGVAELVSAQERPARWSSTAKDNLKKAEVRAAQWTQTAGEASRKGMDWIRSKF